MADEQLRSSTPGQSLFSDVVVFGLAFGTSSVLSYVYVLVAGRALAPDDFGVFNALLGLITLGGFLAASIQLAATQVASAASSRSALTSLVRATLRYSTLIMAGVTIAAMPFASRIGATAGQVALSGAVFVVMFVSSSALGFVAGVGKIRSQAGISLIGTVARLGLGVPLMIAGLGVLGAVGGYLVNYLVMWPLAVWISARHLSDRGDFGAESMALQVSSMAAFVLAFAPYSLDQFMVQTVASSYGGDYAALATVAKPVQFATYPVIAVVYPRLITTTDPKLRIRLLGLATVAVIGVGCACAGALAVFPHQVHGIFFGARYTEAIPHVGVLSFGVACFALSSLGAHAMVAWRSRLGFVPSVVALAIGIPLYVVRHDSLSSIVSNQLWIYLVQLVLTIACVVLTAVVQRQERSPRA